MEAVDRSERLLALLLLQSMKGLSQREKVIQLNLAGFTNVEIADMLETTTPTVTQYLYENRKAKGQSGSKSKRRH